MAEFCTHIPTSYKKPTNLAEAYDNFTLLVEHITAIFGVLWDANQDSESGVVADLGKHLCADLCRRAEIVYEFARKSQKEEG